MRELERNPTAPQPPSDPLERGGAPTLAIVGSGRAGGSIAKAAEAVGLDVRVAVRDDLEATIDGAEAVLLCVPDSAIEEVAARVAAAHAPRFVGHVSGALGLDALKASTDGGAETFVLHPLQTLPDGSSELGGAGCAVTGSSDEALRFASDLAARLGMRPFELDDSARAAYHAAASIASNFLVALEESAVELLARAGVEEPRELLTPLVLRSAANWSDRGGAALTGPIARGDEATVERHLEALAATAPELLPLYEALAERTRALATSDRGTEGTK